MPAINKTIFQKSIFVSYACIFFTHKKKTWGIKQSQLAKFERPQNFPYKTVNCNLVGDG